MENLETALEPEGTRKKLKRELRAEAMTRLEEAARTEADFENVISCWDKLDANRERKERYHEPIRGDMTLENGLKYNGRIFPEWMCSANYTSVRQGRYLDVIFNCPLELNEMTGHPVLCKTLQELDVEYKSLLFFLGLDTTVLCGSCESDGQECAQEDDQTDEQNSKRAVHRA